ncbi:GntR family transcriptional regulator [Flavobacteriaceae bacterium M23B6Z8]
MELLVNIEINNDSRIPKYKQIANSIIKNITKGNLTIGQKIPSINEISEEYYLSRDTVEKAYNELKEKRIIVSAKGKGYYVAKTDLSAKLNVLFLINKLSSYKMRIFNSFVNTLGTNAQVDLHIYHCDESIFLNLLEKHQGSYDYYVIMPHFKNESQEHMGASDDVKKALRKISREKLILLDSQIKYFDYPHSEIYQDFENDIYEALVSGLDKLAKYEKLILVYPNHILYPYPKEILLGFRKFCALHSFDFEILDEIYDGMELQPDDVYITIEENDLVSLVKQIRDHGYTPGRELGVISYNDTPLKELLGITVISTDFKKMGETSAKLILDNSPARIKNDFHFIDRNSI